jgi:hypothetical protein
VSVQVSGGADLPRPFRQALAGLETVELRPEVSISPMPPPQRLAPFAVALLATASRDGDELAEGRLVVLHDPAGQDVWAGDTRCVAYVQAGVDVDMAADPMLAAVGWTWLTEALAVAGAEATAIGGTVTRTTSERFGALADNAPTADVEIRASWSPLGDLASHVVAFGELLCTAGGLPPLPPGVTPIPPRRRAKHPVSSAHRR